MKKVIFGMCVVSTILSISSCSSTEDDPTANLPVCDCVELEPQRDGNGERIDGREHIMYLKDSLYTGKCVTYHLDNTTKKVELIFQKGLLNGSQQVWDEKGNKILEAPMSQGQFHGTLKEWDDKQHMISKMEFEGNNVIGAGYFTGYSRKEEPYYSIYHVANPYENGYFYPNWFERGGGFGRSISVHGGRGGDISIQEIITGKGYVIRDLHNWYESNIDRSEFNTMLNEFHKNNPEVVLNINKYYYHPSCLGEINAEEGLWDKGCPIPNLFVEYCNKDLKSLKFLSFHPDLDKLVEKNRK